MLAQQEFQSHGRCHIEVHNRACLFLARDGQDGEHRRDQHQQERDHSGHHGRQAFDIRVVAITHFQAVAAGDRVIAIDLAQLIGQPVNVHTLNIATHCVRTHRHGTVEPGPDFHGASAFDIRCKTRRDFQCEADVARAHPPVDVGMVDER